jgi:hypothetical protein
MAITGAVDLGPGVCVVTVDHDPTTTATDCPLGSMVIVKNGSLSNDGFWYRKTDDGSSTSVVLVSG